MNRPLSFARSSIALASLVAVCVSTVASAQSRTYTLNADFDEGTLVNVNHTLADQLQLDVVPGGQFKSFLAVSATGRNTLERIDADTGVVFGEYRTAPNGFARNPSRTTVDSAGNVWVGNRDEVTGGMGSVCRIGLVIGGTRVDANGQPNPNGLFLAPPFQYSTAVDRNGDGLIRTSRGLGDVLPWLNVTDGAGGADGIVQDAEDECIQIFQRTSGTQVRHVTVDPNDDVWVGGYPNFPTAFDKLSGANGAVLQSFAAPGCGGHGGVFSNSILWSTSLTENSILRYDTLTNTGTCIPMTSPHGMARDSQGNIWVAQFDLNMVSKVAPNGTLFAGFPKRSGGSSFDRSIAVTLNDDDVWVGNSAGNDVSRLNNNGGLRKLINLGPNGNSPRGVSVDGNGKVWVTNFGSNNAMRIDPAGDVDGLGAVDLLVDMGANAAPYNFGEFTGRVPLSVTQVNGSWNVVYDSGTANTEFGRISWNAAVPQNTGFAVEFRAADQQAQLASLPFQAATNGLLFNGVFGRFVEIQASFTRASPSVTASPTLFDLTIEALQVEPPDEDCVPGQRHPASLLVFPEFDNRRGDITLLSVTNTAIDGSDVDVEFVYIGRVSQGGQLINCLETNRTRRLTPRDTLSLIAASDNPNAVQGYVYVFAKSRVTGRAIVHNHLVGNALVMRSIDDLSYSFNPYAIRGVGEEGTETDLDGDGIRDLNNVEYSCVSDEILVPRFFGQGAGITSDLVLINLTGGSAFTASIAFLVYNDNEEVFSTEHEFQCWEKRELHAISNVFDNAFLLTTGQSPQENIGIETGWFRMDGGLAQSSAASFEDPAFLALLIEHSGPMGAADLPFETGTQTNGDLLPRSVLGDTTP
jgi:streptogramin lyase